MYFRPPLIIRRLYPSVIWHLPEEDNAVYLTFDDGPCPEVTPWVLDQLKKFDAKATFFCLGKNAEINPDLLQRIIDEGHAIGNHSYSHVKGWGLKVLPYLRDIDMANDILQTNIFRPPYARISPLQAKTVSERYNIVMWNIISRDYNRSLSRKACVRGVLKHLHPGAIVVFHDSTKAAKNLWHALPIILREIKERGMVCKRIEL